MKKLLTVVAILLLWCNLAVAQTVEVDFSYEGSFESIRFYINNDIYCEVPHQDITEELGVYTFTCQSTTIPLGWHVFTLTAIQGDIETLHSEEFQWMKSRGKGPAVKDVKEK